MKANPQKNFKVVGVVLTNNFVVITLLSSIKEYGLNAHIIGGNGKKEEEEIWKILYELTSLRKEDIKTMVKETFPSEEEVIHILVFQKKA